MSTAILVDAVVSEGRIRIVDEATYRARSVRMAKQWGDGAALKIRVELEEDASRHGHYKHLFGHLLTPVSEFTGYTITELKNEVKARFLPDGMTSLTDMNGEQFDEFNRAVEQYLREEIPEAWDRCVDVMALLDRG